MIQITTTSLPNGFVGVAYSQTPQQTGGQAPFVWTIDSGTLPTSTTINAGSGAITGTPTVAGLYTFTVKVVDDNLDEDTQQYTVRIYDPLEVTPEPLSGDTAVYVEGGAQQQFTATGGSGSYQWSVTGGNLINPTTGLLTAINGGSYVVTVIDTESGQTTEVNIVITSQSQFCVEGANVTENPSTTNDVCCEFNVECGDRLQLRIASFHVVESGRRSAVSYSNVVGAVTGDASALQSTSADAGATGNAVSLQNDSFFEIVTSFDMAQIANGEFGIGWSAADADQTVESIEHAVVWLTGTLDAVPDTRFVEIRHSGAVEADSQFAIAQGDAVSFGVVDNELQLWINSVLVFTSEEDFSVCGDAILDIGIEDSGKTIGGYVANLTWSIVAPVTGGGSIDANGIYTAPTDPLTGLVKVLGTLNNANFYVNIRNIQPTPRFTSPQAFLNGRKASVWVTNKKATDSDAIRIASDGSPDALQNPGMVDLGTLQGSATFAEEITYQDFENDEGIYDQAVASEKATLTGNFLEVRDFDKLALMMQHATLQPTKKGVKELSVGGKTCGGCDLRVALIVESGSCGDGWDVIYLPRVQNAGNLSLEIGKKTASQYALNFRVLPDPTRPIGKQLYSMYQIPNCSNVESETTCD